MNISVHVPTSQNLAKYPSIRIIIQEEYLRPTAFKLLFIYNYLSVQFDKNLTVGHSVGIELTTYQGNSLLDCSQLQHDEKSIINEVLLKGSGKQQKMRFVISWWSDLHDMSGEIGKTLGNFTDEQIDQSVQISCTSYLYIFYLSILFSQISYISALF